MTQRIKQTFVYNGSLQHGAKICLKDRCTQNYKPDSIEFHPKEARSWLCLGASYMGGHDGFPEPGQVLLSVEKIEDTMPWAQVPVGVDMSLVFFVREDAPEMDHCEIEVHLTGYPGTLSRSHCEEHIP